MRRDNRDNQAGGGYRDRRSGGQNFGNRGFGPGRDFGARQKFQAVCSACGANCEVPFRPSGTKPVYCDDCFSKNKSRDGGRDNRSFGRDSYDNRDNRDNRGGDANGKQYQAELKTINYKLDQILKFLKPAVELEFESGIMADEIGEAALKVSKEEKPRTKKERKPVKKFGKKK